MWNILISDKTCGRTCMTSALYRTIRHCVIPQRTWCWLLLVNEYIFAYKFLASFLSGYNDKSIARSAYRQIKKVSLYQTWPTSHEKSEMPKKWKTLSNHNCDLIRPSIGCLFEVNSHVANVGRMWIIMDDIKGCAKTTISMHLQKSCLALRVSMMFICKRPTRLQLVCWRMSACMVALAYA